MNVSVERNWQISQSTVLVVTDIRLNAMRLSYWLDVCQFLFARKDQFVHLKRISVTDASSVCSPQACCRAVVCSRNLMYTFFAI